MTTTTTTPTVRFTADVITPDAPCGTPDECECSDVYGDYVEHGYGATLESGWLDPSWSMFVVQDEPTEPEPIDLDDDDPVAPIVSAVLDVMSVDHVQSGPAPGSLTVYAADPITNYRTGKSSHLAAHLGGIDLELLPAVVERLRAR